MLQSSKGAELLGASVTQAAFNLGHALGAFLDGLPLAAGYGYTSPALVGAGFAYVLRSQSGPYAPAAAPVPVG